MRSRRDAVGLVVGTDQTLNYGSPSTDSSPRKGE